MAKKGKKLITSGNKKPSNPMEAFRKKEKAKEKERVAKLFS